MQRGIHPNAHDFTLLAGVPFPAVADEEGDLLGGLPRSRPGVRSGKRASGKRSGAKGASAKRAAPEPDPQPKPRLDPRAAPPPQHDRTPGAAEEALRLAGGAAGAVLGTASSVTRGILRRLPKP
jgi:hypothetical protein